VTDHISRFTESGILLKSGQTVEADIIVTATGLNMVVLGGIEFTVDGRVVDFADTWSYKG
jgi:cation diffusion facilitator CzcD-associated flavoprotein CzcO